MATAITVQPISASPFGSIPVLPLTPGGNDLTWTGTSDPTSRYAQLVNSKTVILAQNLDSTSHTVLVVSVADPYNRTGDISGYSVGPNTTSLFGPFNTAGGPIPGASTSTFPTPTCSSPSFSCPDRARAQTPAIAA